ncbi:MAG: hypothetical protein K9J43_07970, partial [Polynucleobacter sp.]|nr:hypothetical protein [Polynucleobacter sp.]
MPKLFALALAALFTASIALAQAPAPADVAKPAAANDCEARAVSKSGKPLAGAAKREPIDPSELIRTGVVTFFNEA